MRKNWNVKPSDAESERALIMNMGISRPLANVLVARGYTDTDAANEFISPKRGPDPDPFLMADMRKAVDRISLAEANGETVGIIGDYDVDGITATAILYKFFTRRGINAKYHIPSRDGEGYGISKDTLLRLKNEGCSLVISVDCGITAIDEAEYCKTIGLDMIVTDHHEVGDTLPDAVAVINPKRSDDAYPFSKLSGVGVAFKLACAIGVTDHMEEYTAFAALGTLADMMPVIGENRTLIIDGMRYIQSGVNVGLSALMNKAGVVPSRFNSFSVSFILAPRMNAAGRMESAETALKLLLEDDEYAAGLIAEKLCSLNKLRQETEAEIFRQAVEILENDESYKNDKVIVLYDKDWHQGVIGIVAAKITEKYEKPAILFTCANGTGKGSGRSVTGFSIHKAVSDSSDLLTKFGGHEYAVGLGIEIGRIPDFRRKINEVSADVEISERQLEIDAEILANELSVETVNSINRLEPYGEGNPQPVFMLRSAKLVYMKVVGEKHTRISLRFGKYVYDSIYYGVLPKDLDVAVGDTVDAVFSLGINEYNGQKNLQIVIKDIAPAGDIEADLRELEELKRTGILHSSADMPRFADFERVYRALAKNDSNVIIPQAFAAELSANGDQVISTLKLLIILSVFSELSLITLTRNGDSLSVSVVRNAPRTDLDKSVFLRRLKENE